MAKNYKKLATQILESVGGASNVNDVFHCMTRLRFKLKDESKANEAALKEIEGVLGLNHAEDTLQVIIGPSVNNVYKELLAIGGLKANAEIEENLDKELTSKKFSLRKLFNNILFVFSNSMNPLVPLFVTVGMLNVVAAIIGPSVLGLVTAESALYNNFYYAGQAILYFLPVFVAITASKHFGSNKFLSVALACMMLYPDLLNALAAEGGWTVYGIAAPNVTYSAQLIPILLVVWVQSYVEKFLNKIIPDSLKVVGVGFCTVLIMLPLTFCILGPIGFQIGSALISVVMGLYAIAGPIETALVSALIPFMTAFGVGRPIFFACLGILMSTGVEYAYMPIAMVLNNFLCIGVAAGYLIKTKGSANKQLGATCLVANALGGVSEPSLFGIILPNPRTYPAVIAGGLAGGLYLGIMKVGYYQFGPSNVLAVLGFMGGEGTSNFVHGCIAAALCTVVSLVVMLVTYKDKEA